MFFISFMLLESLFLLDYIQPDFIFYIFINIIELIPIFSDTAISENYFCAITEKNLDILRTEIATA